MLSARKQTKVQTMAEAARLEGQASYIVSLEEACDSNGSQSSDSHFRHTADCYQWGGHRGLLPLLDCLEVPL